MRRREALIAAGAAGLGLLAPVSDAGSGDVKKSFGEIAASRRSVRRYTDEPIRRERLEHILTTALLAPTSWGEKVVEFVVVEDREMLRRLAACKRIGAPSVAAATAAVVVLVNRDASKLWIEDGSVAATYVLLGAEEEGIGACWNQIRDRQGQAASAADEIRGLLHIPESYGVLCIIALGQKGEHKQPKKPGDMPLKNIHWGKF